MYQTTTHLDDEHMRLYEWSGAGAGMTVVLPEKSKRTHRWHASYAVLGLLVSLLALNGCDRKGVAEQAGQQVDQAIQDMKDGVASPGADIAATAPDAQKSSGDAPGK
ncbi:MAG: hypothetical protein M0Z73_12925 [Betaproteobacteria bacterium]|nr:hypothetical protein [Betaproteobacteria bacterium]